MTQLTFEFAKAARGLAYARSRSSKVHADILALLKKNPELCRQEIADLLGLGIQSVCRPVLELLTDGALIEAGSFRKTRYGGNASLVKLAPKKRKRSTKAKAVQSE